MMLRSPSDFHDQGIQPTQHYTARRSEPIAGGERKLMLAILEDAMACARAVFRKGGTNGDEELEQTMAWFEDLESDDLFSFRSVCEHLDVPPAAVLARLERLRDEIQNGRRNAAA